MLEKLLEANPKSRKTGLDLLRQPPTNATTNGLIKVVERLEKIRLLGSSGWNISNLPMSRIRVMPRYSSMARAQTILRINYERLIHYCKNREH